MMITWIPDPNYYHSNKMFFIIGLSGIDVTKEIELNDDIIIGEFEDNYENLALKTMLGYQYSINYCSSGQGFQPINRCSSM